jgi:hypothetical protein
MFFFFVVFLDCLDILMHPPPSLCISSLFSHIEKISITNRNIEALEIKYRKEMEKK